MKNKEHNKPTKSMKTTTSTNKTNMNYINNTTLLNNILAAREKKEAQKEKTIRENTRKLRIKYLEQARHWDFGDDEIEDMIRNGTWKLRNSAKKRAQAVLKDMPSDMTDFELEKWLEEKAAEWDYENYAARPRIEQEEEDLQATPDAELSWAPVGQINACTNMEIKDLNTRKEQWLKDQEKQPKIHCPQFYCVTSFTVKGKKHTTDSRKHLWYFDPKTKKRKMTVSRIVKKNQGTCRMVFVSKIIQAYYGDKFLEVFGVPDIAMISAEAREMAFKHICDEEQKHITMDMCLVQSVHQKGKAFPCLHISFEPNKTRQSSFKHDAVFGVGKLTDEDIVMMEEGCLDVTPLTIFEYEDLTILGKTDESDNPLPGTDWEGAIADATGNKWRGKSVSDMHNEEAWYISKCMQYDRQDLVANAVNGEAVASIDKWNVYHVYQNPEVFLFEELAIDAYEDETGVEMQHAITLFGKGVVQDIIALWVADESGEDIPF